MNIKTVIRNHPIASYFGIAFTIPWLIILLIGVPRIIREVPILYNDGILFYQ